MRRNIFLIVGVLVGIALIGGVGYYFVNKKDKTEVPKEEVKPSKEDEEKKKEEEYYNYLTYVPVKAYNSDYTSKDDINKLYLLGLTLDKIMIDKNVGNKKAYLENTEIDAYLNKMFNLKLSDYNLDKLSTNPFPTSLNLRGNYIYNNHVFNSMGFKEEDNYIRYMADYRSELDNLIVNEYILEKTGDNTYQDLYKGKSITIDGDVTEYIKNNLDDLTKYEITFKKNGDNYYWVSLEVTNDPFLKKTYNSSNNDNYDNRMVGKEIALNADLKSKTMDFITNYCVSQSRINLYINKNYYPTIWSKFDYAIHKLIEAEHITSCPEDYSSEDCYFDLAKIKPYYIKYFGEANYNADVPKLISYEDDNTILPRYKDNKYFLRTACGEVSGPASFYEELDKVIEVNNTIEVYVRVGFIDYEYNNNLVKQSYYRDYAKNNLIYETSYFNGDDYNKMINNVIPSIKNNLATYKYVLPKEGDNYYFDHIERIN